MKSSLYAPSNDDDWNAFSGQIHARPETDYCSRDGAAALKEKIEAYWRERGQDVMLSLHNVGFHPAIRAARYDVRSDMVNGLPRGAVQAPAAHGRTNVSMVDAKIADEIDDEDSVWLDP
ncbi:MAG TPA: hypothetical protein VG841_11750 [Caulobacterales bacterium]|nr:hypothetical protein [Caulobacterales bacterium]